MKSFKEAMEEAYVASADFKVSKSGRKVHKMKKVNDEPRDMDGDGDIDAKDKEAQKKAVGVGESVVPAHMQGKQKPYVSSDGKGNYEVLGNKGQTKATFSRKEHGKDAQKKAQAHLHSKYDEYMKEDTELEEAVDKQEQRFLQLARLGLVDKTDVSKLRIALDQLKADKPLSVQQRGLLLGVMSDLMSLVTGDDMIFNRVKRDVQKEDYELIEEEEIVLEGDNKQMKGKDPCWKGYQMVGMKDKNGKKVPNCVPTEEKEVEEGYVSLAQQRAVWATRKDGGKGHPDNKKKMKKEEVEPPFDPDPPKKKPSAVAGKHGLGYSTARHLARLALKKQQQKQAEKSKNK